LSWVLYLLCLSACTPTAPPSGGGNGSDAPEPRPIVPNDDGTVITIAGTGQPGFSGDGGPASSATFDQPMDLAVTPDGRLLIADTNNHRIRSIDLATGIITTIAGTGATSGEGALFAPTDVTPFRDSRFAIATWEGHRIYEFDDATGLTLRAGEGSSGCAEPAADDPLADMIGAPRSLAILADESILIAEQSCHRVRRLVQGELRLYAGTGEPGYSGDDGPADMALLAAEGIEGGPCFGIALSPEDPPDQLFIADTANHVIRQVQAFTNRMETLAGSGDRGFTDGPPENARFNRPSNVYCSRDHAVWVADAGNHAIRYVDPLGTRVSTVIGTGEPGFNGDNLPPQETQLDTPTGVWVTDQNWVFVVDRHRIRLFRAN
jgi:hypothetical protein